MLSEPRVDKIVDEETGSVLKKTTRDNSHDVFGWDYDFTFHDDEGTTYSFETRVQELSKSYTAYRKQNPQIKTFTMPGFEEFQEEFYKKHHIEYQIIWFYDKLKFDDQIYRKAARKFCAMYLRFRFSYEFNREDYEPGMEGSYLGKIHFYASPRNRLPSFEMEVGGDD